MKFRYRYVVVFLISGLLGYSFMNLWIPFSHEQKNANSHTYKQRIIKQNVFSPVQPPDLKHGTKQSKDLFDEDWLARMERRQHERKERVKTVCHDIYKSQYKDTKSLASNKHSLRPLIVNERFQFVYSIVYKVGSTNWERVIVQDVEGFKGVPNQRLYAHKALHWMPKFSKERVKEYLDHYTKFIFVRNPLSRILSAYRDKFVEHKNKVFTKIAKDIIRNYRNGDATSNDDSDVAFQEFIKYIVKSADNRSNPHWKPVFIQNIPCSIEFDIIGKLEDAKDDIPYVLKRTGIWNVTDYGKGSSKKATDMELIRQYYSQLPPDLLKKFYSIYEPDFLVFGYDMPIFN